MCVTAIDASLNVYAKVDVAQRPLGMTISAENSLLATGCAGRGVYQDRLILSLGGMVFGSVLAVGQGDEQISEFGIALDNFNLPGP